MRKDFELFTSRDNLLRISTYSENSPEESPCIIYIHGFKGFKDWGYVPFLCDLLSTRGYFVISFNFSHNGIGEDLLNFTELEKFANNTISLEVEELNEVIQFYRNGAFGFNPYNTKIGLIGHSRGGAISLIHESEKKNVNALALWGTVAYFDRYSENQKKRWLENGYFEVLNTRTNQMMRLNKILLEDFMNNKERFNLLKRISQIEVPILIVHGDQDLTVPLTEGMKLYESSNKDLCELYVVEKAGHTFDIVHPFQGSNPKFDLVAEKTIEFFKKRLN